MKWFLIFAVMNLGTGSIVNTPIQTHATKQQCQQHEYVEYHKEYIVKQHCYPSSFIDNWPEEYGRLFNN